LAAVDTNVFAALGHDSAGTGCPAHRRPDGCTFSATKNGTDYRANSGRGSNPGNVIFGGVPASHSTFGIHATHVPVSHVDNFDNFGAETGAPIVRQSDLIEGKLQLGNTLNLSRSFHSSNTTIDDCSLIFTRLHYTRLKAVATLSAVGGQTGFHLNRQQDPAGNQNRPTDR
jgi:hypothetical protein